jgi:hypothetical protein
MYLIRLAYSPSSFSGSQPSAKDILSRLGSPFSMSFSAMTAAAAAAAAGGGELAKGNKELEKTSGQRRTGALSSRREEGRFGVSRKLEKEGQCRATPL